MVAVALVWWIFSTFSHHKVTKLLLVGGIVLTQLNVNSWFTPPG